MQCVIALCIITAPLYTVSYKRVACAGVQDSTLCYNIWLTAILQVQQALRQLPLWSVINKEGTHSLTGTGMLECDIRQHMCCMCDDL